MKITKDNTLITYARNQRLEIADSMKINYHSGDELAIAFNPYFLVDALKVADSETILISGTSRKAPIYINANKYLFLILPENNDSEIESMKSYLSKLVA